MRLTDSFSGNSFGVVNVGGGVKGTSQALSLIGGDAIPDLLVAGQGEANSPVYIVNGALIPTLSGNLDVAAAANQAGFTPAVIKISNGLPAAWGGYAGQGMIVDSNHDGFPDFAVGEFAYQAAGRTVVFY